MSDARPTCGLRAFCGRPANHRGHCGGWRTGVAADPPGAFEHFQAQAKRRGSELSTKELELLAQLVETGNLNAVAAATGQPESTLKNRLAAIRERTGAHSTIEAYALLGWLRVPADLRAKVAA